MKSFTLELLACQFAVCQLDPHQQTPAWATGDLVSITRTTQELSIVCPQHHVPASVQSELDWRCLRVAGTLDFSMIGVIASITGTLAAAGISVFVFSTFDTDYLLIKQDKLTAATRSLTDAGHCVTPVCEKP